VTPESIRAFCADIGVAKFNSTIDVAKLENAIRDDLNKRAPRVMAVLDPLKVVITNYPEGQSEELDAVNNPEDASAGSRRVPFSRELYIERDDFLEDPPKKFFRLGPGREVRLRYAYFITCTDVIKDADGNIVELRCTYDPATRGGDSPDGRKVKGTLHWVSAQHAIDAEVRLYDRLFIAENPDKVAEGHDWKENLNPESLTVIEAAKLEPSWQEAADRATWSDEAPRVQFERQGYFTLDPDTKKGGTPVFNRTATLKDTWAKIAGK
jgi:glutaminyl-tRNA synthetase